MAYWMLVFSGSAACPALDAIEVPLFSDFRADYEIRAGTELCKKLEAVAPPSNARWVQAFLREVKTIYHFTAHHGERREEAMKALRDVMWSLQQHASPAISYAEGEGYYDREGSLLTWEFDRDDGHRGTCVVALRSDTGWLTFSIDLAAAEQREAFKAGVVPAGAPIIGG